MAKVWVQVQNATVDGHGPDSVIQVEEKSAKHLESIRYVKRLNAKEAAAMKKAQEEGDDTTEDEKTGE